MASNPPASQEIAKIQYLRKAMFPSWQIEVIETSLSEKISLQQENRISLLKVPFDTIEAAEDYFFWLKECRGERIVRAFFRDNLYVMVESMDHNIQSFFKMHKSKWKNKGYSVLSWWRYIKPHFMSVFGDILQGLSHLTELGFYCGNLKMSVVVSSKGRAKLLAVQYPKFFDDFHTGSERDITDLHWLLIKVLLLGYESESNDKREIDWRLIEQGLPSDLISFLKFLGNRHNVALVDKKWIYDDSAFWDSLKKKKFIDKFWDIIYRRNIFPPSVLDYFIASECTSNWRQLISHKDPHVKKVVDLIARNRAVCGSELSWNSKGCAFDITRLYRDLIEHYNDKLPKDKNEDRKKRKCEISAIADCLLHGFSICCILRRALEKATWLSSPPLFDMTIILRELLSETDF